MATSTYMSFLMYKASDGDAYEKLVDIKSYPNLGGEPDMLDITTLSDRMTRNIPGIQSVEALSFTANYDKAEFAKIYALRNDVQHLAVWLGGTDEGGIVTPTGSEGKFEFEGYVSIYANGGEVNAVREMTITVAASSTIEMVTE